MFWNVSVKFSQFGPSRLEEADIYKVHPRFARTFLEVLLQVEKVPGKFWKSPKRRSLGLANQQSLNLYFQSRMRRRSAALTQTIIKRPSWASLAYDAAAAWRRFWYRELWHSRTSLNVWKCDLWPARLTFILCHLDAVDVSLHSVLLME